NPIFFISSHFVHRRFFYYNIKRRCLLHIFPKFQWYVTLGKLTGKDVTLRYDEDERKLYFENEAQSIGVTSAAFGENAYVRVNDAMSAYKNITDSRQGVVG
ncbi:MAG: hypothetical protein LBS21_15980, partial [Clostridiales bacterium]|nr:hypothetical protein [Clostridiales bacterium]